MYNKMILIGTLTDDPRGMVDPEGNWLTLLSLKVPLPLDAPPTHWGLVFDLRGPDPTIGDDTFLVVCRDRLFAERCYTTLLKGDVVCVEGRLVLTLLTDGGNTLPLAEILASDVIPLAAHANEYQPETPL